MRSYDHALRPRLGGILKVLIIARISTLNQDIRSLDEQVALCMQFVRAMYAGQVEFKVIRSQGSGEILDSEAILEAVKDAESGHYDLVITEDLGRICRRTQGTIFCEACEDAKTRLIAINDSIDTAQDDWHLHAFFATMKHEMGNKDTAARIRRTLRERFMNGGVVQKLPYGYVKPPGTKSDADVFKDEAADAILEEIVRRLENKQSFAEVADWMNRMGIATGSLKCPKWTGTKLGCMIRNPIYKGYRQRNVRKSKRVNKSGHRISEKAPASELLLRPVPHLRFIEEQRYDRLIAMLRERNQLSARGRANNAPDPRLGVSRKRTVWPGQHIICGVCGRLFYWGGHGQTDHMMCSGVRENLCWNSTTFDGHVAGQRLSDALLSGIENLPDFDTNFRRKVELALRAGQNARIDALQRVEKDLAKVNSGLEKLADAVEKMGYTATLEAKIKKAEAQKMRLESERDELIRQPDKVTPLPSLEEIKDRARSAIGQLDFCDPSHARLMHKLMPRIEVLPYQLLDSGAVVQRAHATIQLLSLIGDTHPGVSNLNVQHVVVDLFDPPQRAAFRAQVVELRADGMTERDVAKKLVLTVTAAQHASALQRMMDKAAVSDPYQLVTTRPHREIKAESLRQQSFQFQPLEGYPAFPDRNQ